MDTRKFTRPEGTTSLKGLFKCKAELVVKGLNSEMLNTRQKEKILKAYMREWSGGEN
jgi:hypothetical protein